MTFNGPHAASAFATLGLSTQLRISFIRTPILGLHQPSPLRPLIFTPLATLVTARLIALPICDGNIPSFSSEKPRHSRCKRCLGDRGCGASPAPPVLKTRLLRLNATAVGVSLLLLPPSSLFRSPPLDLPRRPGSLFGSPLANLGWGKRLHGSRQEGRRQGDVVGGGDLQVHGRSNRRCYRQLRTLENLRIVRHPLQFSLA